jgi:hypothetical protein
MFQFKGNTEPTQTQKYMAAQCESGPKTIGQQRIAHMTNLPLKDPTTGTTPDTLASRPAAEDYQSTNSNPLAGNVPANAPPTNAAHREDAAIRTDGPSRGISMSKS